MGMFDSLYDTNGNEWQTKYFDQVLATYHIGDRVPQQGACTNYQIEVIGQCPDYTRTYATVHNEVLHGVPVDRDPTLPLLGHDDLATWEPPTGSDPQHVAPDLNLVDHLAKAIFTERQTSGQYPAEDRWDDQLPTDRRDECLTTARAVATALTHPAVRDTMTQILLYEQYPSHHPGCCDDWQVDQAERLTTALTTWFTAGNP